MLDIFENIFGALNYYEKIFGLLNRMMHPSKGGRFGETVTIRIRRIDKGGTHALREVTDHLNACGVPTFDHAYDANWRYFKVRKTQAAWAKWLYNGGDLRTPAKRWERR